MKNVRKKSTTVEISVILEVPIAKENTIVPALTLKHSEQARKQVKETFKARKEVTIKEDKSTVNRQKEV